jgi:glutamate/tyrosine decarboxylase-like PLP-dependent enzyme
MWFHVDGAYGAVAAHAPGAPPPCAGWSRPIRWPSIRTSGSTRRSRRAACWCATGDAAPAFSYHPSYYGFDDQVVNFFDYGPQNSRGFRALKVWLALQQAGRDGYLQMIGDDMRLAAHLHACLRRTPSSRP